MPLGVGEQFKGKFKGNPRQGISSLDTVYPFPDDQPAGHSGLECPRVEKGKDNTEQAAQLPWETTPGGSKGPRGQVCTKQGSFNPARLWGHTPGRQEQRQ